MKTVPVECVIKLRNNWICKAVLQIKKSFKSIDFNLAKHASISALPAFELNLGGMGGGGVNLIFPVVFQKIYLLKRG